MFKHLFRKRVKPKRILFHRDLKVYYGGHQKVADYFHHLTTSTLFDPHINFSLGTRWDEFNPWFGVEPRYLSEYVPSNFDYVFLAGMDWPTYLSAPDRPKSQPVINLIQHVRHADPNEDVFKFLGLPAIRICVSHQVADAIKQTGLVKGPVFTVPNGVELPALGCDKKYDLVILGIKQPGMAAAVYEQLAPFGLRILLVNQHVPRQIWLSYLAASRIALLLPHKTEGFYLPALEAMKYCDLVIVPDCIGNRDFCKNNQNCLMPEYNDQSIVDHVKQAIECGEQVLTVFRQEMNQTLDRHSLVNERKAFLEIMTDIENLWPV